MFPFGNDTNADLRASLLHIQGQLCFRTLCFSVSVLAIRRNCNESRAVRSPGRWVLAIPARYMCNGAWREAIVTLRNHPKKLQSLVSLCEPADVGELALIRSLLDGNGIPYAVQHEHIGALYPGVALLGSRVMVAEGAKHSLSN